MSDVTKGLVDSPATKLSNFLPQRKVGGDSDGLITGGESNDTLIGGGGIDTLVGLEGDDRLIGNDGGDIIVGYGGNDKLDGGAGDDYLFGGDGNDALSGGAGKDTLGGGAGDDFMVGGNGADEFIVGGGGHDVIYDFNAFERDKLDFRGTDVNGAHYLFNNADDIVLPDGNRGVNIPLGDVSDVTLVGFSRLDLIDMIQTHPDHLMYG